METNNRLQQTLNRITDTLVVGLLITAASLPVVTAFVALRAGVTVLTDEHGSGALVERFVAALRQGLGSGLVLGAVFVAAAGIGAGDLIIAMSGDLGAATVPAEAAGLALLLAATVLPPWAATISRLVPDAGLGELLRRAVLVAAARPGRSATLLAAVLAGAAATAAAPILAPVALGLLASMASRLPVLALKPATAG